MITVNQRVVGSSPTGGATKRKTSVNTEVFLILSHPSILIFAS